MESGRIGLCMTKISFIETSVSQFDIVCLHRLEVGFIDVDVTELRAHPRIHDLFQRPIFTVRDRRTFDLGTEGTSTTFDLATERSTVRAASSTAGSTLAE